MFEDLDLKIDSANASAPAATQASVGYWCSNVSVANGICAMTAEYGVCGVIGSIITYP
jgi:hypothetical protein